MLAAILPDSLTRPTGNPSIASIAAGLAVISNPVQRLHIATEIGPHFAQAHAITSRVTKHQTESTTHIHRAL